MHRHPTSHLSSSTVCTPPLRKLGDPGARCWGLWRSKNREPWKVRKREGGVRVDPFALRRNRPTPLHGAFRCHQTDGTPQPHARSKRENPPSWLSGGVERRPVNREGTTTSTTEPLRRVRWNRAKSLTSKAQHPTCPSARASATNGRLQLLRMAPKAPKERRR